MWRWIIRIWCSIVVFWFLMFISGMILASLVHLSLRMDIPSLRQGIRQHDLLTMFLLGVVAGLPVLGSGFTGRGWFRSKSGLTYEGFKLEVIKRWMWLLISPVFIVGVVGWIAIQHEGGAFASVTLSSFYHDFLMPDCSNKQLLRYTGDTTCAMNLLCVGTWLSSVGYSLAPFVRRHGARLWRNLTSFDKGFAAGQ